MTPQPINGLINGTHGHSLGRGYGSAIWLRRQALKQAVLSKIIHCFIGGWFVECRDVTQRKRLLCLFLFAGTIWSNCSSKKYPWFEDDGRLHRINKNEPMPAIAGTVLLLNPAMNANHFAWTDNRITNVGNAYTWHASRVSPTSSARKLYLLVSILIFTFLSLKQQCVHQHPQP